MSYIQEWGIGGQYLQILHPDFDFMFALLVAFGCSVWLFDGASGFFLGRGSGFMATLGGGLGRRETRGKMRATSLPAILTVTTSPSL